MGMHTTFHTLVVLMAVLSFSAPFRAIAQQDSVRIEAETAASQDANAVSLEAKVAAEQNASGDINKLLWFATGMGVCCIGGAIGGFTGCYIGDLISPIEIEPTEGSDFFMPIPAFDINNSGPMLIGGCIGVAVGILVPFIGIYSYPGDPPAERLLGKSPEYVESYTKAYKERTRWLRTSWAVAGAAGGGFGLCLFGSIFGSIQ